MSDALPWRVPPTWAWTDVGRVAEVVGGGTPRTNDPRNFQAGTIPWITPADLSGYREKFIEKGARNITPEGLLNSAARVLPAGAILFSSRAPIGYVAIARHEMATNQGFKSFVLPPEIAPDYAYYYLQRAKDLALRLASGTTFPELSARQASKLPLALAPLAEQHRIVEAIESYFTRLDDAQATLERVQRNLKRYRASVLKAAVEGRLVPTEAELARAEGRDYEPASLLVERIQGETRGIPPIDRSVPEGWVWVTLQQLTLSIGGGTAATATSSVTTRRVLRSSAIRQRSIDFEDYRFLPEDAPATPDRYICEGELLFTRLSGTLAYVGNCAVVPSLRGERYEYPDRIFRARLASDVDPEYVALCFGVSDLRSDLEAAAKSSAGHQRISLSDLRSFKLPLPPAAEQRRIVSEVDRVLSVVEGVADAARDNLTRSRRLRQSILKWAFEGRLVDQDPNDEPASLLLERIKAERAAAPSSKAKGKRGRKTTVE